MDNIYSKFYTGNTSPFGIGTWDSNHRRKLNKSSSLPYFPTNVSNKSNNLILPPVNPKYENGGKYIKQYPTQSSSSSISLRYDTNKNRKELSNYIKDINYSVANKLQNDNFIAQQKLNNLKNNYNEIKTLLNNKLEKLEQDQQMQFDNLKYALGQGGGLKMLGAVKNANGGNNYDLQLAEQEDIIDATRKLPKLLDKKINEAFGYKKYNRLRNGYDTDLMPNLRKMDDELKRQRSLDDMKFRRELDEIEAKRENMRHERQLMLQELQNQEIDSLDDPFYMPSLPPPQPQMYNYNYTPYNPYMVPPPPPPYFIPPMNTGNNNNNNSDSMGELIKLFLIKKLFDDNKQNNNQNNQAYSPQYQMPYMPMQPLIYKQSSQKRSNRGQYGYPPMMYPNYQNNPMGPNPYMNQNNNYQVPNGQGQKQENQGTKETESQKGIPFVDPLEKYLEMVNKAKGSDKKTSRKSSTGAKPIKLKNKKKKKTEDDSENDEDNENDDGDGEDDDEGGGDVGDGEGDGDGDGGDEDGGGEDGGGEDGGEDDGDGGDEDGGGEGDGGEDDGGEEEGGEE